MTLSRMVLMRERGGREGKREGGREERAGERKTGWERGRGRETEERNRERDSVRQDENIVKKVQEGNKVITHRTL